LESKEDIEKKRGWDQITTPTNKSRQSAVQNKKVNRPGDQDIANCSVKGKNNAPNPQPAVTTTAGIDESGSSGHKQIDPPPAVTSTAAGIDESGSSGHKQIDPLTFAANSELALAKEAATANMNNLIPTAGVDVAQPTFSIHQAADKKIVKYAVQAVFLVLRVGNSLKIQFGDVFLVEDGNSICVVGFTNVQGEVFNETSIDVHVHVYNINTSKYTDEVMNVSEFWEIINDKSVIRSRHKDNTWFTNKAPRGCDFVTKVKLLLLPECIFVLLEGNYNPNTKLNKDICYINKDIII
jgi:hypothetical protein